MKNFLKILGIVLLCVEGVFMFLPDDDDDPYQVSQFSAQEEALMKSIKAQNTPEAACDAPFVVSINPNNIAVASESFRNEDLRSGKLSVYKRTLNLSEKSLEILPREIAKEDCIETLDLSKNYFRQFPMDIFKMKGLKKVDLSNNTLMSFPALQQPSEIVSFKLNGNRITSVPKAYLLQFKNIEHLYLKDNEGISSLPDEIAELKTLKNLDIRGTTLAKSYVKVTKLMKLLPNTKVFYRTKS